MSQQELSIDVAEMCSFIEEKTGHSVELIDSILDCELAFLGEKGLLSDEPEYNDETEKVFIDTDELEAYIAEKLTVSRAIVGEILEAENSFMIDKGIMND